MPRPAIMIAQVAGLGTAAGDAWDIVNVLLPETILVSAKMPVEKIGAAAVPVNRFGPANWVNPSDVLKMLRSAKIGPVPKPMVAVPATPLKVPETFENWIWSPNTDVLDVVGVGLESSWKVAFLDPVRPKFSSTAWAGTDVVAARTAAQARKANLSFIGRSKLGFMRVTYLSTVPQPTDIAIVVPKLKNKARSG